MSLLFICYSKLLWVIGSYSHNRKPISYNVILFSYDMIKQGKLNFLYLSVSTFIKLTILLFSMKLRVYPALRCFHKISDFLTMLFVSDEKFEKEFEKWVKGKKAVYTYRARTGLFHLLTYLKRKFNVKRILVPSYTCKEVIHPIKKSGLEIAFVDNDLETLGIDNSDLKVRKNDVLLWVNYFGIRSKPPKATNGVFIIEDNASFFLPSSGYADFTLYSLGKGKEFSSGEGGIVVVNKSEFNDFDLNLDNSFVKDIQRFFDYLFWRITTLKPVYPLARKIRNIFVGDGEKKFDFTSDIEGINLSLSTVSKRLAYLQLRRLDILKTRSKHLWEIFYRKMKSVKSVNILVSKESNYFSINFLANGRDELKKFLESKGIFASIPWNYLIGNQVTSRKFKNSTKILENLLQIKIDPTTMSEDDISYITDSIKEFYRSV